MGPIRLDPNSLEAATRLLLAGAAQHTRDEFERAAAVRQYAAGTSIFMQGDPPGMISVLQRGLVKVWRALPDGGALTLTLIGRGAPIGTLGAVRDAPHTATATAMMPVQVIAWPIDLIRRLMIEDHALTANLLLIVTNYAEQMIERVEEIATVPVEQRLARTLLRASRNPWVEDEPTSPLLPLSRQDLADLTSTTLPTVSRIMSRWRTEGLVDGGRGRIQILDRPRLCRFADLPDGWDRPLVTALDLPT